MIPIYIPSRSRPDRLSCLEQFTDDMLENTTIVVPMSQVQSYETILNRDWNEPIPNVMGLPDEWTISLTRQFIGAMAYEANHERFAMIDDDIKFMIRKSPAHWQLREATIEETFDMFRFIELYMIENPRVKLVGVSAREGNNRPGVGTKYQLVDHCSRIHRTYFWSTAEFRDLEHNRVTVAEDFDLALQSLRRGNLNALIYYWAQGQKTTQDTGGASEYRSLEVHNESVKKLAQLHPHYVRVVQKDNASGGILAKRLESVIAWKKAAGFGKSDDLRLKEILSGLENT